MFLTTNLEQNFDDAALSRIHISVHFEKLTIESQAKIWKSESTEAGGHTEPEITLFSRLAEKYSELTGRGIKDLVHIASIISKGKHKPLSEEILAVAYALTYHRKQKAFARVKDGEQVDSLAPALAKPDT
jgi:hypothetical protein